jgi:hypothetical protein
MGHPLRWFLALGTVGAVPLLLSCSGIAARASLLLDRREPSRPVYEFVGSIMPKNVLAGVTTDGCSESPQPSGIPRIQARCKRSIRIFDKVTVALRERTPHTRWADLIPLLVGGPGSSCCVSVPSGCAVFCRFLL